MVHIHWRIVKKKHLQHHYVNGVASAITLSRQKAKLSGGRGAGLTDSHTEKLSSSPAEIRTHANDSADAERP